MGNLFDYLEWRGDLLFSEAPFNDVDSLIFSLLSYIDFNGIVPESYNDAAVPIKAAANTFFARNTDINKISMGLIVPNAIVKLFRELKDTRRFRNVNMKAHVNIIDKEKEMQFSATTFIPDDHIPVIAFRGTDDTIIGWKENFNMSFSDAVPAQTKAVEYLNTVASYSSDALRLTGHSKGGNLAVYAAVHCDASCKKRILRAWNNDGPGFRKGFLSQPAYLETRHLIRTLVPQSSLVGMLLEHDENYTVVKSRQNGLLQHDGMTWEVKGNSFVHLNDVRETTKRTDKSLNEWIEEMNPEQRKQFTDALYQLLSSDNASTLTELVFTKNKWLLRSKDLDPQVHQTLSKTISALINTNTKNLLNDILSKK